MGNDPFPRTRWSVVRSAGEGDRDALQQLCTAYWLPLYAYARRRGWAPEDAQDGVQAFFGEILGRGDLAWLDPARGRFRAWLLTALRNSLLRRKAHDHALKRGGGVALAVDWAEAERIVAADGATDAEQAFVRRWTLTLLQRALDSLAAEYRANGSERLFTAVRPALTDGELERPYAAVAEELGTSVGALKVAVHRLRKRYRHHLLLQVADTVDSPDEAEDELRFLLASLG
jgi:RNA polymerase sigma-70 factor (ECF subfamily)